MADLRPASYSASEDRADDTSGPDDPLLGSAMTTPTWSIYDGRPEDVSDGVPRLPAAAPPPGRGWLRVAGVATAMVVVAGVAVIVGAPAARMPKGQGPEPRHAPVIAPAQWSRVDASLTAGLVVVNGAAEADGIVMTSSGLVATSYARIMGDSRPRGDGFEPRISADGHDAVPATIVGKDAVTDIALVQATGFAAPSVATPGTPVRLGDTLTLLDDQGGRQPILGVGVTVTATDHLCSRAGSTAHPTGFQFSLDVASAEPGAAIVRADGTVVGMYFGGDDATHHCGIPIADIVEAVRVHNR